MASGAPITKVPARRIMVWPRKPAMEPICMKPRSSRSMMTNCGGMVGMKAPRNSCTSRQPSMKHAADMAHEHAVPVSRFIHSLRPPTLTNAW